MTRNPYKAGQPASLVNWISLVGDFRLIQLGNTNQNKV
jgi:hypothetical protein